MAIRSKKVLKALAENNDNKKKTPSEYNKDGTPKNWPKVLKKVPMNRNVRIKDLPAQPVFKDEDEKQQIGGDERQAVCRLIGLLCPAPYAEDFKFLLEKFDGGHQNQHDDCRVEQRGENARHFCEERAHRVGMDKEAQQCARKGNDNQGKERRRIVLRILLEFHSAVSSFLS